MAKQRIRSNGELMRESMMQQIGTGYLVDAEGPTFSVRRAG